MRAECPSRRLVSQKTPMKRWQITIGAAAVAILLVATVLISRIRQAREAAGRTVDK